MGDVFPERVNQIAQRLERKAGDVRELSFRKNDAATNYYGDLPEAVSLQGHHRRAHHVESAKLLDLSEDLDGFAWGLRKALDEHRISDEDSSAAFRAVQAAMPGYGRDDDKTQQAQNNQNQVG